MEKLTITIELPGPDEAPDLINKLVRYRKAKAVAEARRLNKDTVPVDPKLEGEEYLKSEILTGVMTDFREIVMNEAKKEAAKKASEEFDKKFPRK